MCDFGFLASGWLLTRPGGVFGGVVFLGSGRFLGFASWPIVLGCFVAALVLASLSGRWLGRTWSGSAGPG